MMKIAIGCDHGGIVLKPAVIKALTELGAEVVDLGTYDESSVDYPVYGLKVAEAVASGDCDAGVLMCGTGIGISISANKVKGIRAAVVTNEFMAEMTKRHNNANIIALGGRVVTPEQAESIVKAWFTAEYEGGRHQRRLDMIADIESKYCK
ncbi:MAG TPA: ribose 5-phosphate isomerase B [Candidatus Limadaptatus stercoripullorum]|uniref:Ribose 5-phosphate isomerase B n=1 Tax=Candidatus Limadaptatus stercoripullorum TaxID=2840846 RepID=A0A9D1N8Y7_9FIRM|nr:ribose 5-phosphate isomerase B [Candidatus Limadaptatus stercoripullorum]